MLTVDATEARSKFHELLRRVSVGGERIAVAFQGSPRAILMPIDAQDAPDRKSVWKLRESEERLRDFAEAASDWFWETGPDERFTYVSEQFFDAMQITGEAIIGRTRREFVRDFELKANPGKWRRHFKDLKAHRAFRNLEYSILGLDREIRHIRVSGIPIFDRTGRFRGYRGADTDITERMADKQALRRTQEELERRFEERTRQLKTEVVGRRKAERELRKKRSELMYFNRISTMTEMMSELSHEINQPLAAINGYAVGSIKLLRSVAPRQKDLQAAMAHIITQSERASAVICRLRDYVIPREPQKTITNLNLLINETVKLLEFDLLSHDVEIEFALADPTASLTSDYIQLQQVLVNLLVNGMEAMQSVGSPDRRLTLATSYEEEGSGVTIMIRDCGRGLDKQSLKRVFEPRYTTKTDGLGMGLSICQTIVGALGGRLWAESDARSGSVFCVWLPTAPIPSDDNG